MYALFLGFGLAMGANVYESVSGKGIIGPEDYSCSVSHPVGAPWWQRTASNWYGEYFRFFSCSLLVSGLNVFIAFLTVPMFSLLLSLRNQASYKRKELVRGSVFVFFHLVLG